MEMSRSQLAPITFFAALFSCSAFAQTPAPSPPAALISSSITVYQAPQAVIDSMKDEGLKRSQVMQTIGYLTENIGARLTGSPAMLRANEWTRGTLMRWGLQNARIEAWGSFGRGWELKRFEAQVTSPYSIPIMAYPKAWSPSTRGTITADSVYLDAKDEKELAKYRGKLRGKIVLISKPRDLKAEFEAL